MVKVEKHASFSTSQEVAGSERDVMTSMRENLVEERTLQIPGAVPGEDPEPGAHPGGGLSLEETGGLAGAGADPAGETEMTLMTEDPETPGGPGVPGGHTLGDPAQGGPPQQNPGDPGPGDHHRGHLGDPTQGEGPNPDLIPGEVAGVIGMTKIDVPDL